MSEENVISNVEDNSPKNEGVVEKVIEIFKNGWNKQVILYGPPGTSKTYSATIIAAKLLAGSDRVDTQNPYIKTIIKLFNFTRPIVTRIL